MRRVDYTDLGRMKTLVAAETTGVSRNRNDINLNSVALQGKQTLNLIVPDPKTEIVLPVKLKDETHLTLLERDSLKQMVAKELARYKSLA